jgi:hypothetical protein
VPAANGDGCELSVAVARGAMFASARVGTREFETPRACALVDPSAGLLIAIAQLAYLRIDSEQQRLHGHRADMLPGFTPGTSLRERRLANARYAALWWSETERLMLCTNGELNLRGEMQRFVQRSLGAR